LETYEQRFAELLNYATLPFYWGSYEPQRGVEGEERLRHIAGWCGSRGITTKGHPLIWHEVYPAWADALDDREALSLLERRVREIAGSFAGLVETWDVVNEATVSHRFDNAVGRWIAREGAAPCVEAALRWAREANPSATLLYNDFNLSPAFEQLVADLLDRGAPLDAIGIQSHMHKGTWSLARVWEVCETFARFGLPLHWTELTVLSGRLKAPEDDDWHRRRPDWESTPAGEGRQAAYGRQLYTLLYSHPAVEAITWWDLSDYQSWQGAPAGLLRADMSPKPLYDQLLERVHGDWHTHLRTRSDTGGRLSMRGYYGDYVVTIRPTSEPVLVGSFALLKGGPREVRVECGRV
jgi:GH35 family endo-1,4-beta-xylanase